MQSRVERQWEAIRATAVTVKVLGFNMGPAKGVGLKGVASVEVMKQPKEHESFPKRFKIIEYVEQGGTLDCGHSRLLFEAMRESRLLTATLSREGQAYSINTCTGYYKLHNFCSAISGCDGVDDGEEGGNAAPLKASERSSAEEKWKRMEETSGQ